MTQGSTPSHDYARRAALTAAVDGAAAEVIGELANAGVRSILLKGRAFASWLYTENELRSYGDVDLLLSPTDFSTAESVLAGLGFLRFPVAGVEHADTWSHESAHMEVELHRTLIGVSADPGRLWEVLSHRTEPLALGNTVVEMLDAAGRTLHVALHAAQHGTGGEKPLEDLARALNQVPRVTWECALSLGEELDATEAFAAGLRLMPEGERLATELQLSDKASPSTILMTGSPPPAALGLARVASTRGVRA